MTASRFHQLRLNVPFINVLVGIYLKNPAKMLLAATPLQTLAWGANIIPPPLWQGLNVSSGTSGIPLALLFAQEVWTTPNVPIPLHKQHVIMGQWNLN